MSYVLWDIVIHVVCIVGYSYTCSMYCGDAVIHVVCIVGIQLYMQYVLCGYSYTCSMYCGGNSYTCRMYCGI